MTDTDIWHDLGYGHSWRKALMHGTDEWVGITHRHGDPQHESFVAFAEYGLEPMWSHSGNEATLTLSPSLLCRRCGSHGFIKNGKWVPA